MEQAIQKLIEVLSITSFEKRLDKFWKPYNIRYNFERPQISAEPEMRETSWMEMMIWSYKTTRITLCHIMSESDLTEFCQPLERIFTPAKLCGESVYQSG